MISPSVRDRLSVVTDNELRAELERREENRRARETESRKEREVAVICPGCEGRGLQSRRDAMSDFVCDVCCDLCRGKGWLTAIRR